MTNSTLTVDCDDCSYSETTTSYERAQDLYDSHHITTGHRPPIDESGAGAKQFKVVCERHGVIDETDYYERGKDIKSNHHIVTGCNPWIEER